MDGYEITVSHALESLLKDKRFYRTSGGVTISGGEPLFQAEFTFSLAKALKEEGIHVILDTCGYAGWDVFERLLPYVDEFYYDLKHMDEKKHKGLTGVSNGIILENLKKLSEKNARISVRFPVIPGCNDEMENLQAMASLIDSLHGRHELWILPYHRFGIGKYEQIQKNYLLPDTMPPSGERMEEIREFFKENGIDAKKQ